MLDLQRDAVLSPCGNYRYVLRRQLRFGSDQTCLFIMLNPSTADATEDDPTIRKCAGFAKRWGYDWLHVVNLFAYRTSSPTVLLDAPDPVGKYNDARIADQVASADLIVCAWGKHGDHQGRAKDVLTMLGGTRLHYLMLNSDGSPRHPLYLRNDLQPTEWVTA